MAKAPSMTRWAPRVPRSKIRRLYEMDAQGIVDEELIAEVAYAFHARCVSILTVSEAVSGKVKCPSCGKIIVRQGGKEEMLRCNDCSWETTWGEYLKTYQHKQLSGGGAVDVFKGYVAQLPTARSPEERMLLIDRLIHECHRALASPDEEPAYTRPVAVNLIGGSMTQVIALLDDLAYGPGSTAGAEDRRTAWRERVLSSIENRPTWLAERSAEEARIES